MTDGERLRAFRGRHRLRRKDATLLLGRAGDGSIYTAEVRKGNMQPRFRERLAKLEELDEVEINAELRRLQDEGEK